MNAQKNYVAFCSSSRQQSLRLRMFDIYEFDFITKFLMKVMVKCVYYCIGFLPLLIDVTYPSNTMRYVYLW